MKSSRATHCSAWLPQGDTIPVSHQTFWCCCRRCSLPAGGSQASEQTLPGFSAAALSRFFFVLGRTSLQHLLCIESLGKAVRQTRLAAGRAAAEAADRAREAAAAAGAAAGTSKGAGKRGGGKAAAAATAAAAAAQQQADDIAGMLGAGAVTADAELDDLVDMIEAQVGVRCCCCCCCGVWGLRVVGQTLL